MGLNIENTPMGGGAQSPERPRTLSPAGSMVIRALGWYCGYTVTAISLWGQFALRKALPGQLRLFGFAIMFGFFVILVCAAGSCAQEKPAAPEAKQGSSVQVAAMQQREEHRFWDGTNAWLFAGTGAARTLDYFSTLNMRRRGRQEILLTNEVVDNHAAFAVIEAAGTGVSIGAAYLFHRSGHHKLERLTSIIHISAATTGGVRNYCLKTAHPVASSTP